LPNPVKVPVSIDVFVAVFATVLKAVPMVHVPDVPVPITVPAVFAP